MAKKKKLQFLLPNLKLKRNEFRKNSKKEMKKAFLLHTFLIVYNSVYCILSVFKNNKESLFLLIFLFLFLETNLQHFLSLFQNISLIYKSKFYV